MSRSGWSIAALAMGGVLAAAPLPAALAGEKKGFPLPDHVDQFKIHKHSFEEVWGWGQKLFHAPLNSLDGVGSNLAMDPPGELVSIRFARSPRADLPGWLANPRRPDGPQSQNCGECHRTENGGVFVEQRDPLRRGDPRLWITRKATNLAGAGVLQLLAEQSTAELAAIRESALSEAQVKGKPITKQLITSNKVSYGSITAHPDGTLDDSGVVGMDKHMVVMPYHLKAEVPTLRFLVSASLDQTVGVQNPERALVDHDADFDGVVNELSVGDSTAVTVFIASLPRPVTKIDLHNNLGGKYKLTPQEIYSIKRGEQVFAQVDCATCHVPKLHLKNTVFREPSPNPTHRYPGDLFPVTGYKSMDFGLDPAKPVKFDVTNNPVIEKACPQPEGKRDRGWHEMSWGGGDDRRGRKRCFLQFESDGKGGAWVYLYGDQKRYEMGPGLAEAVDEFPGTGPSVWRTKELWNVGNTGPWLHDGRATTLTEAILWHGGEAQASRDKFAALAERDQDDLIAFLKNLVVLPMPELE
jgi:mono/diheme cytochrome c family protein